MPSQFETTFPSVAAIEVELVIRKGGSLDERPQNRTYSAEYISPKLIRCTNPLCSGGGWDLWEAVQDVIEKKETSAQRGGVCQGREKMNRTESRTCLALFQAEISVKYK